VWKIGNSCEEAKSRSKMSETGKADVGKTSFEGPENRKKGKRKKKEVTTFVLGFVKGDDYSLSRRGGTAGCPRLGVPIFIRRMHGTDL